MLKRLRILDCLNGEENSESEKFRATTQQQSLTTRKLLLRGMKGENLCAGKVRKIVIDAFRNYWWLLPLRQAGWRGIGGKKYVMEQSRVIDTRFSFDFHSESRCRAGKTRQRRALCVSMEIKHKSRDLSDKCWEFFFSQKALTNHIKSEFEFQNVTTVQTYFN